MDTIKAFAIVIGTAFLYVIGLVLVYDLMFQEQRDKLKANIYKHYVRIISTLK